MVHFPILIGEYPEVGDFLGEPCDVCEVICGFDPEEDEEAVGDGCVEGGVDFHGGGGDALEEGSHGVEGVGYSQKFQRFEGGWCLEIDGLGVMWAVSVQTWLIL